MPRNRANLPIMAQGKFLQAGQIAQKWAVGYFCIAVVSRIESTNAIWRFASYSRSCWGDMPQARRTARAKARGDL